jgi:hypothetical protein
VFYIDIEITDGKEHQEALYCVGFDKADVVVEVQDCDTGAILASQPLQNYNKGKWLVWNLKGKVALNLVNHNPAEGGYNTAGGVFFDPVKK